jgi:magnesium-transporting ATPase (P-type)
MKKWDSSISILTWIMIGLIIGIVLMFIYFLIYDTDRPDHDHTDKVSLALRSEIDRVEANYITWIILSTVFLIMTFRVKSFEAGGAMFSVFFMIVSILLFILANVEYLSERKQLFNKGIIVFTRLDYLFAIITLVILICVMLLYDILKNDSAFTGSILSDDTITPCS